MDEYAEQLTAESTVCRCKKCTSNCDNGNERPNVKGGTEEEAVEEVGQEGEETKLPGVPSPSPAPHSRLLTVYDTVTRDTAPHYTGLHRTRIGDTGH